MTFTETEELSFDIAALHAAYAAGLSPRAVMIEALRRIEASNDPAIFISLRPEPAILADVSALPPFDPDMYPLWGVPFAIKDNIDMDGLPTTAACPAYAYAPESDAFVVARLRAAGAIALGKTNLDQFATGLVGVRSPYGVPKNAVDASIVPGGSSSGSAVAVARGIVSFALGTDTAGSGRVPAALNNIVGLKPSLGALSATGVVPACRTLDTISIFALTVPDAWSAFRAACGHDPDDAYSRRLPAPPLAAPPARITIAVPDARSRQFFGDDAQAASFSAALDQLRSLDAQIVEIDFSPFHDVARMLYEGAWVAERMTVVEDLMRRDPAALHPVTAQIIGAADALSAADAFKGIYRLADLRRRAETLMAGADLLCVPSVPTFYTVADLAADPVGPNSRLGTYTNFVNLMDMCGIAVPVAARSDGRPGSVTLLARCGQDVLAAGWAQALQDASAPPMGATGTPLPRITLPRAAPLPDETAIALVGAHMAELPLNHQITSLGGRFLEATETAPEYRFFALAGGPPARPGLLRVAAQGASVALELWSVPTSRLGALLVQIPSPLGLGRVTLVDGRDVVGFLVEPAGLDQAEDITSHGGWRAYLATRLDRTAPVAPQQRVSSLDTSAADRPVG
ncbi:MAG: allophanate hydrolase [Rhodobacteraceae bacterium]|nr:MAG: allophanate hydrolase [Paracoccaceae bacterium]